MSRRSKFFKTALSAMHYSRADDMMAPFTRGVGVIFTLHHVRPQAPSDFEPNRILAITPDFLKTAVEQVLDAGFDILSMDDAHQRMSDGNFERPFAVFTFDDGYKDNAEHAIPFSVSSTSQ